MSQRGLWTHCHVSGYPDKLEITDSARRHGIFDHAMLHAVRQVLSIINGTNDLTVYIGADDTGRLLEVGIADVLSDNPRIVHAMPLRATWFAYLR